ncbi:hypothetical protein C4J81_15425 [Deltaproteobacteria bacterium Smac51]|nr:hypothetical protein C4J81_03440 [Deltaproteobacteria bacterium Smac51]UQZ89546.1 hypothetical protein C4J81_10160 [Deltaproteobacteria bacterium Smac51]UQZ90521.1 hypothetical protein C4J81_15425 [Deltaproteobacteria bacterium Smac51]
MDAKLKRLVTEDRRLVFLCLLSQEGDYSSNNYVMKEALAATGHSVSGDQVATDAAWLSEQGLITTQKNPLPNMSVFRITSRGRDVAKGRAVVPGVKQPEPGLDY